jgi:pimeloyl-ACP methyl ester carboxylesterase
VRERFVDSGDLRIHVVEQGPEDGQPVLFLHGFPEFWWSWRHQLDACAAAGYRAVAMDLRGFGDSDKPKEVAAYSVGKSFADVTAVIGTLGERVALVSHDWGGAVGWAYAAFTPEKVERLVVMNAPHPNAYRHIAHDLRQLQASWYVFLFQFEGIAEEVLARNNYELFKDWFYGTAIVAFADHDLARFVEVFSRPGALTAALSWYRANIPPAQLLAEDRPQVPSISCPTMVIWGCDDAYLTFDVGRRAKEFVSGPFVLHALADTGHWVQQERPREVNKLLLDFLATDHEPSVDAEAQQV